MAVLNEVYAQVRATGEVNGDDAMKARRAIYGGGSAIARPAVEMLLKIEEAADRCDPAWEALLAEATIDHLVHESDPEDTIDDAKADWLLDRISTNGKIRTARQLELLIRILEDARSAPEPLVALALRQVRAAVVDGEGPLAGIADADPGRVTREETTLVRRILYAFGGQRGVPISRAEAEIIFDINDAASGGDNDPGWTDLFVKAIANCIMAASGYASPPREVALAEEDFAENSAAESGGFVADVAVHGLRGILDTYITPRFVDWAAKAGADAQDVEDGGIGRSNATWLAERIGRDGNVDDNEKALLRFIREEARTVHPALRDLILRAA